MVNATEDSSWSVPLVMTMTRSRAVSVMETSLKATLGIGDGEYDEIAAAAACRRLHGRALEVKRLLPSSKKPRKGLFALSSDDGDHGGSNGRFEIAFRNACSLDASETAFSRFSPRSWGQS